ncbi:MAG: twin-arginine translocase subunit TatC [Candidatus Omnitrophica bacterium CG11_big_fil_rev_8_21_14_0_20_45_26]|uniref:Sec-independent protein translocase protein TatC n=1 Tax=Candidatus Abzuiibacterium crystallinum TaxID=1974748 RepID=A0A2H0LMV9_9BACT|nr:MAG: twin-arginine translocase subunit TatC [Candidatus Omnitrophica bacterium CG11_big_fil_rev_8_21_14_0_20_45_26]PIW64218.1 MAG: twin-arginine translocase subunit TatC [Candidatus Omnitrophica bacterium CG12_big_fil_rev_8_21_14_0_65_45_16]
MADDQSNNPRASDFFADHLNELRKRIFLCLSVLIVLAVGCYFISDQIYFFLTQPIRGLSQKLYFLEPYGAFAVKLQITLLSALFFAAPLLLTEIWLFVAPGLYTKEKKAVSLLMAVSIFLFVAGCALAFFAVVPFAIRFFLGFSTPDLQPIISIQQYMEFVAWLSLGFGAAFQAPIFLIGLVWLGVVKTAQINMMRPYVIVGLFVFAALLTPPDPLTQCLLAIPLWGLFEVSYWITKVIGTRKKRSD